MTDQLSALLSDSLYFLDLEQIDKVSGIVSAQPDIEYVQVFDPNGRLLAHTGLARFPVGLSVEDLGRSTLQSRQRQVRVTDGVMELTSPVTVGGDVLGGVWVGLGSEALEAQTRAIIIEHTLQGLALVALGAGLSYFIARQLSRPVRVLVDATNRIASGQLDARVDALGGELGELAGSFNRMAGELQARVQDLQESRARIVTVQEGVRRDMAAHLHGRIQGRLLVLKARLQEMTDQQMPENARSVLLEIVEQMGQVIQQELSGVSRRLYPSILRRGVIPALESLCDEFESSFELKLEIDEKLAKLERANRNLVPEHVRLAAYRTTEEALANAVKHAQASRVSIKLELSPENCLRLAVRDNGRGFDVAAASSGLGMAAIMDYAGAVGGQCVVESAPGQGAAITSTLPLPAPRAAGLE